MFVCLKIVPVLNQTPRNEYVWESGVIAPYILTLDAGRKSVVKFKL